MGGPKNGTAVPYLCYHPGIKSSITAKNAKMDRTVTKHMEDSMTKTYSSKAVANEIIRQASELGIKDLTPMKLQKLIYYCHSWHLALFGDPLLSDEVQAWTYGPVIPDIYHEYKNYGNQPVLTHAKELSIDGGQLMLREPFIPRDDVKVINLIQEVLGSYGELTPIQISNLTHQESEPWKVIANMYPEKLPRNIQIPNELIKDCFIRMRTTTAA
jgi:uncharacterized phage-associated protein